LNNNFGAAVWDCRRNIVLAGGAAWDTTLLTAPYQCGPTHSSNAASVFQSVATRDFTLINAPNAGYYLGTSYANGYQVTVGYSETYLAEMLAGVGAD
ncbi:MAG: hypothetical protein ACYC3L_01035, partial [Gemmatimonadaceae bacterium]